MALLLTMGSSAITSIYARTLPPVSNNSGLDESHFSSGAEGSFNAATSALYNMHSILIKLMEIIVGLAALFAIFMTCLKIMKGDRESAERLLYLVVFLSIGFILFLVLGKLPWNTVSVASASGANGFGVIRACIANFFMALFSLIIIINLGVVLVYVINGDKEGVKKLVNWLLGSVAGFISLNIIGHL